MNPNYTEILMILDKSGSMAPLQNDTIGTVNKFIEDQKKLPGKVRFSLLPFNTKYEHITKSEDIHTIQPIDTIDYCPDGMTALYDAVMYGIRELGYDLVSMPESERPSKVIVVIITDGEENSSKEYKQKQVLDTVKEQKEKYSWEFLFLGANIDAVQTGTSIGVQAAFCCNFSATCNGVKDATNYANHVVSNVVRGNTNYKKYSDAQDFTKDQQGDQNGEPSNS